MNNRMNAFWVKPPRTDAERADNLRRDFDCVSALIWMGFTGDAMRLQLSNLANRLWASEVTNNDKCEGKG